MISQECSIKDCKTVEYVKGYCQKHYARQYIHGDPNKVTRIVTGDRVTHPLYKAYHAMLGRCHNASNSKYSYYGGRGITVDDRWRGLHGFDHFIADMGDRPDNMTLDRIDNDKGYSPSNCRWATHSTQQHNRGKQANNTSGYPGISLFKKTGRWQAYVYKDKRRVHLGYYGTLEEAVKARQQFVDNN